ncbi:MAG TPA: O-antigen ligase family protein, partial [Candidatus Omnitrophota bacterium]|nr:O-antigen ligase family protein [Candidatus Omnitrophota bacterium]
QRFMGIEFLRQKEMVALWGKSVFHGSGVTASFEHYNDFGTYLVFMLSLVFALLISKAKRIDKLFLFFLLLLLQASLILTFSRGSWLALGHVFLLMLPLLIVKNKFSIFKVIAYVLIFLIIILVIPGLGKHLIFILSTKTDADRLIVWQQTINMIKLHPFLGFGLGTFMDNFQDYMPKELFYMRYVHNCYLQIWAEAGIFSLLSFLIFTVSILYRGIKGFYSAQNSNFTLLGFTCGFLGIMVHSFFDTPLYSLQLSALFWFMAGFILALARLGKKKEIL